MKVFIVTSMLIAAALAAPSISDNQVQSDGTYSQFAKIVGQCADSGDLTGCLSIKGIAMLNRAAKSNKIELAPGVAFTRDQTVQPREGKAVSESEIAASLPADPSEKSGRLVDLAIESAMNFMNTHNLQVKLPSEATEEFARALEEGRRGGKLKKMMGPLLMAVAAKFLAVIPLLLGGLALLATKALVVAKIAFVLAAVLGAQRFLGGGAGLSGLAGKFNGGAATGGQGWGANAGWSSGGGNAGWSSGSSGSYPYARSMNGQDLAYSAQAPAEQ